MRPLRILVSAFWFSPVQGSECAVGWDYVQAISERHKVWVITRTVERAETERYLSQHPQALSNVTVHYIPMKNRTFYFPLREVVYALIYKDWQKRAYQHAVEMDQEVDFDLVHQLNGIGFREPGYLWKLKKPFVWGPVGGLQFFPVRLLSAIPWRRRQFYILKNLSTAWEMYAGTRPRRAARAARAVFAASGNVAENIRKVWGREAAVLSEVSAPKPDLAVAARRAADEPLKIVWCGSCEPRKALNLVLMALAQLGDCDFKWKLIAVGGGPLLEDWQGLADRFGILENCSFVGKVPRTEVQSIMATGHCLVQPSLYDATSTVVAEALSHGLPVICLDHFGFRDVVSEECGIKIRPGHLNQVVRDFAQAVRKLAANEDLRWHMGIAAKTAANRLTLDYKKNALDEIYNKALFGTNP